MVSLFDCKHSRLIENNVSVAFIMLSRWLDGAGSLGLETTAPQPVYGMVIGH